MSRASKHNSKTEMDIESQIRVNENDDGVVSGCEERCSSINDDNDILTASPTSSVLGHQETRKCFQVLDIILDNLHPMHFVITMGVGITSGILYNFPIECIRHGSRYLGIAYFYINLTCFIVIHLLFIMKYFFLCDRYKTSFKDVLYDHRLNVFLGCEVMGTSTLINMIYFMRPDWYVFVYVLWWINVAFSILVGWGVTFLMFACNKIRPEDINATILLPIVTLTVVASTGSLISVSFMDNPKWQISSNIITFLLFANAVVLSIFIVSVYFERLFIHGLPPKPAIYTCFIPIGILGQGGWAIQLNYKDVGHFIAHHSGLKWMGLGTDYSQEILLSIESVLNFFGVCIALVLASVGVCFTVISFMSVIYCGKPPTFIRTMWASTFPLGTMALSFNEMFKTTNIQGFHIVGTIYSVMLFLITTYCLINTVIFEIPFGKIRNVCHQDATKVTEN